MFDIGWSELLVLGVVAIIVVGPRDLPRMLRTFGQYIGKMKRMASEFQSQFNDALREAEMDDLKKDVESATKVNPVEDIKREFAEDMPSMTDIGDDLKKTSEQTKTSQADTTGTAPAKKPAAKKQAARKSASAGKTATSKKTASRAKPKRATSQTAKAGGSAA